MTDRYRLSTSVGVVYRPSK